MEARHDAAAQRKVFDLIQHINVAQLVTTDSAGRLHARPMVARTDEPADELWFFTDAASGKIGEIEGSSEVLLTYSDPSRQNYVSVEGDAEVVHDVAKVNELWSEPVRVWFPKGAADPDIALIRVKVREATYWDAPSSAFVHAYGYVKAVTTGERPHPGDVARVDMTPRKP